MAVIVRFYLAAKRCIATRATRIAYSLALKESGLRPGTIPPLVSRMSDFLLRMKPNVPVGLMEPPSVVVVMHLVEVSSALSLSMFVTSKFWTSGVSHGWVSRESAVTMLEGVLLLTIGSV